jgi:hypothetical protein
MELIEQFSRVIKPWETNILRNNPPSDELFNTHLSHPVASLMYDNYIHIFKEIQRLNPSAVQIFISMLPIPKYFDLLHPTVMEINNRIRDVITQKPDRIFIPLTRAFLIKSDDPLKANTPDPKLFDNMGIHPFGEGNKRVSARITQFLNPRQLKQKLDSQLPRPRKAKR